MRRFEFVEGSSSKFWQIALEGTSFTVEYGRIGAAGQTQSKSFADAAQATKEHDKLVAEKVKKGYVEVGAAATPAAAAIPAAPAKPVAPPPAPKPSPAPVASAPAPVAPAPAPVLSEGGALPPSTDEDRIFWTPTLRRRVFPWRGAPELRVPPLASAQASWATIQTCWKKRMEVGRATINAGGETATLLQRLEARLSSDTPSLGTPDDDVALIAWIGGRVHFEDPEYESVLELFVALGGYAYAVTAALRALGFSFSNAWRIAVYVAQPDSDSFCALNLGRHRGLDRLRALLAVAPDADYAAARDAAAALRGSDAQRAAATFLFPTEPAWIRADLRLSGYPFVYASADDAALLTGSVQGIWKNNFGGQQHVAATLLDRVGFGAVPFIRRGIWGMLEPDDRKEVCDTLACVGTDDAVRKVLDYLGDREGQAALSDMRTTQPNRTFRMLAERVKPKEKSPARVAFAYMLKKYPGLATAHPLSEDAKAVVAEILAEAGETLEDAPLASLPRGLQAPWKQAKARKEPVVTGVVVEAPEPTAVWLPGEQDRWAGGPSEFKWADEAWGKFLGGGDLAKYLGADYLAGAPSHWVERLAPLATYEGYRNEESYPKVAGRHGLLALAFYRARLTSDFAGILPFLVPFGVADFAPPIAEAFSGKKSLRDPARAWLLRHPEHAAAGLLPTLLGKPGRARTEAEAALRFVVQNGQRDRVLAVATTAGVRDAAAAILDVDPIDLYPTKLPKRPEWLDAETLPRPALRSRTHALPVTAVDALLTMLQFSTPDAIYAGIAQTKEVCDPGSLARFAWTVFQAWIDAGGAGKDSWCMQALALIGDDGCMRRLEKLMRVWPGNGAHARAVAGLDVLTLSGTDVALMLLNGIALKSKFKGLQESAKEKIQQIAESRGLTTEELEDRLAPDLGLDDDGSLVLDFGPRTFRVGFDEQLRPTVKDAAGAPLKDLPKPNKGDDEVKAAAAVERWSALKKDARQAASMQILRLELCMCGRRRFEGQAFVQLFVEHPLVFHIVRRLVWAVYDADNKPVTTFRVAEDRTFADAADNAWELPAGATVGIPHPLELSAEVLAAWGQIFADYEILQPFAQVGRPTWAPTEEEKAAKELNRAAGRVVPTGRILGLEQRRWQRGRVEDAGVIHCMQKVLPNGDVATLHFADGIYAGSVAETPQQTLESVTIGPSVRYSSEQRALGTLDSITFSELVRDLEGLQA